MESKTIKINRRSANITEGKSRAPNRSMYYGMGYEESDFGKPMIGVANGHSTITPCNSGLQKLADAAVAAIEAAGMPKIEGRLYKAAVILSAGRVSVNWQSVAEHFNPSRQLITAHTSQGAAFSAIRVSAR
jgi:dihydroxyacid dehydratase/phosphogluconate dehydratase